MVGANSSGVGIVWSPEQVEKTLFIGSTALVNVSFVSKTSISQPTIFIVPEIEKFIKIRTAPQKIIVGTENKVDLVLSIPADTPEGTYAGTIHVRDGKRTIAKPLPITLHVQRGSADVIPTAATLEIIFSSSLSPPASPSRQTKQKFWP